MRRRLRMLPLLAAWVAAVVAALPSAGAAELVDTGWWWRVQGDTPVTVPPPPNVPPGGAMVQSAPSGALAVAAVRFSVGLDRDDPVLTLRLAESGNQGVEEAVVLACPATTPWEGGDAQPWSKQPVFDCVGAPTGAVAADATTVTFELPPVDAGGLVDVVLVPGTTDGAEFDGTNASSFTIVLEPPESGDLVTSPSTAETATTSAAEDGGGGVVATPPPASTGSGSTGAGPRPAVPIGTVSPPSNTATPTTGTTAPPSGSGAETAATLPPFPTAGDSGSTSFGELLPLLVVLALGPGALLALRQPRVAAALAGGGGAVEAAPIGGAVAAADDEPAADGEPVPILQCRGVTVRFGGLQALGGVDLDVYEGEIVGLIGPNGAGKTTLMECISGFQRVTEGTITYRGEDLLAHPPGHRATLGIGRTLQNVRLFPYLTVIDNVRVALHRHQSASTVAHAFRLPSARDEERTVLEEAERIIGLIGMEAFAEKFASELSYGTLRLLELGCMLALKPSFLLLDEPASGISQKETEALGPLLRDIQRATGATILMIEHDMPLVMSLSDRVYCLDAGTVLSAGTPQEVQEDPRVAEAYLGTPKEQRKIAVAANRAEDTQAEMLLEVEGLDVFYDKVQVLYGVDFHVRRGERIALLGTNGAGKSTILKAASGLVTPAAGTIRWKGEDITNRPAERLVRLGLGQVPGGRGLFPTLTVGENLRMGGYIYPDESRVDAEVARVVEYFQWIAERSDQQAGTLSGGEQQQLATARALMTRPELLMIDELSLGLAPLVIERLMDTVQRLCDEEGLTVVIVEQQASFALGYTDRAYFMEKGEVRYEGPSAGLTERGDLLRSVFLAGASAGFAGAGKG